MRAGKQMSLLDRELNEFQANNQKTFNLNLIRRIFRNASMSFRPVSDVKSRSDLEMASRKAAATTSITWRGS